jgi:hypothetical protein
VGGRPVIKGTRIEPEVVLVDEEYGRTPETHESYPIPYPVDRHHPENPRLRPLRGKVVIAPKPVIDRSQFPAVTGEYTPAQPMKIRYNHLAVRVIPLSGEPPVATATKALALNQSEISSRQELSPHGR